MKKQMVLIHGGDAFSRHQDFLECLRTRPIDDPLGFEEKRPWRSALKEALSEKYEVYMPSMPNKQNAKYIEWKIWFERYFEFLHDSVILIGHSLGGWFLAKYLVENTMPVKIQALYLLAAPFEPNDFRDGGVHEDGGDFNFDTKKLIRLGEQVNRIFIFHSKDDLVVSYEHALKYKKALPVAQLTSFEDKGHFILEEFPELVESVRGQ